MIAKEDFLKQYNISEEDFRRSRLEWAGLMAILENFSGIRGSLEHAARYIVDSLSSVPSVHSLKLRIKDPEHLVAKVIRKKLERDLKVTVENYRDQVTDLVGVRALHLFKEDWIPIHKHVTGTWDLFEKPVANVRSGDPEEYIAKFKEAGCEIYEHPLGYRAVHYVVKLQPEKTPLLAEVQVRTIFEEGFSEVDHRVRYPFDLQNPILNHFLIIFNRLAGSADEMASFVRFMKTELGQLNAKAAADVTEKTRLIEDLTAQVMRLRIEQEQRSALERDIESLSRLAESSSDVADLWSSNAAIKWTNVTGAFQPSSSEGFGGGSFMGESWFLPATRQDAAPPYMPVPPTTPKSRSFFRRKKGQRGKRRHG